MRLKLSRIIMKLSTKFTERGEVMPDDIDEDQQPPEEAKKPYKRSRFVAEPEDIIFLTREESDKWTAQRTAEIEAHRQRDLDESGERRKLAAAKSQVKQSPL